ncbi:hypothetical protein OHT61_31295 [Streptomyces sp. NBC_00178]|uniref:hypothetical protein n=1 Tax=Streptomyces sp. NBC_00178 TaxID=2975672 RepID=UPI002E290D72|nr:hypothetical protein [Streptomyces sp. NBC_00178]
MSERTRDATAGVPGDCLPGLAGPDAGLPRVLACFEHAGHQDPTAAWDAFTRTWNWAAPLAAAFPVTVDGAGPVARAVPGGFALSGRWRPPTGDRTDWVAVPVPTVRRQRRTGVGEDGRDLFVLPERTLPRALPGGSGEPEHAATFELTDAFVPAGLATRAAGTALRVEDTLFLRTAVTAMALGAARRVTDALAGLAPDVPADAGPAALSPPASAAELAAVLHDERTALAAALRGLPDSGEVDSSAAEESAVTHLTRVGPMVRHVVVAAYERALPSAGHHEGQSLVHMVEGTSPILQCMRFAVETLPPLGKTTTRKAQHGDERRISG